MLKMKLNEALKEKSGFGTILAICLITTVIPFLLFVCVDAPYYLQQDRKLKYLADSIAGSTATILREDRLADGIVEIDTDRARAYLLEEVAMWFNLQDIIYDTEVPGVKLMKRLENTSSMLDVNPAIIEITPDMRPITDAKTLSATRIEYFIHSDQSTRTYTFTTGQKIQVSTPTVGIFIGTRTRGVVFRVPVKMKKIGITEAYLNPDHNHHNYTGH